MFLYLWFTSSRFGGNEIFQSKEIKSEWDNVYYDDWNPNKMLLRRHIYLWLQMSVLILGGRYFWTLRSDMPRKQWFKNRCRRPEISMVGVWISYIILMRRNIQIIDDRGHWRQLIFTKEGGTYTENCSSGFVRSFLLLNADHL